MSEESSNSQDVKGKDNIVAGSGSRVEVHFHNPEGSKEGIDEEEAIKKFSNLPTDIIPPPSSLPAGSRIAFPVNQAFVGRGSALRQLARTLKGGDATAIGQVTAAPVWVVLENLNSLVNSRIDTDSTFPVVCSG